MRSCATVYKPVCKLSSEYSSSVPKSLNRKDVEAADVKERGPELSRMPASYVFCFTIT